MGGFPKGSLDCLVFLCNLGVRQVVEGGGKTMEVAVMQKGGPLVSLNWCNPFSSLTTLQTTLSEEELTTLTASIEVNPRGVP